MTPLFFSWPIHRARPFGRNRPVCIPSQRILQEAETLAAEPTYSPQRRATGDALRPLNGRSVWTLRIRRFGESVIFRHALVVRLTHWVNVLCLLVLLMSGLQIFNAQNAS